MLSLHPLLRRDTFPITELTLCQALLMNNRLFPWVILVPQMENAREIIDLPKAKRYMLMDEIASASSVMKTLFNPHKINIAALGNQVEQLHVHIIARFEEDAAWPNPVWGGKHELYERPEAAADAIKRAFMSYLPAGI